MSAKQRTFGRAIVGTVAIGVLMTLGATPAYAQAELGYQSCDIGQVVGIQSRTTGPAWHSHNSSTRIDFASTSVLTYRWSGVGYRFEDWTAAGTVVDFGATYAYCTT